MGIHPIPLPLPMCDYEAKRQKLLISCRMNPIHICDYQYESYNESAYIYVYTYTAQIVFQFYLTVFFVQEVRF